ncbi:MAG: hypothetical protein BWY72_02273 [Bacteroidetes bacterium ADurb.Bin416]|nr:MAG: hypothetical protein BWY72_02273 [Bacteroidetes bacterium ADurb.Bin416]
MDVTNHYPINHIKRFCNFCYRLNTTNLYVIPPTGTAACLSDGHTGHGALQGFHHGGSPFECNVFWIDGTNGAGQVGFALGTVPDYDHLIQGFGVFSHDEIDNGTGADHFFLIQVADETGYQGGVVSDIVE